MKTLSYGEILENGLSQFYSAASLGDNNELLVTFRGKIRVANPYRSLHAYLEELKRLLPRHTIAHVTLDFVHLEVVADHAFYTLMDIVDTIYNETSCPVLVRRVHDDAWQDVALPILLNSDEDSCSRRTSYEEVRT